MLSKVLRRGVASATVGASKLRMPRVASNAADAVAGAFREGDSVFIHGAAATPEALCTAFTEEVLAKGLTGVTTTHIHTEGRAAWMEPAAAKNIRAKNMFVGANARKAIEEGRAEYCPMMLSEIPALFTRGIVPVDVALISVSPPDKHGWCSLGPSVDISRAAVGMAKKVIAMVNPQMPRTFGDSAVHQSRFDVMFTNDVPLAVGHRHKPRALVPPKTPLPAGYTMSTAKTVEGAIGKLIADYLVPDGATLQVGIGGIPDAVLASLSSHKDLGLHSEMISDGVAALVEAGVINNRLKTVHAGLTVAGFAVGAQAPSALTELMGTETSARGGVLYDWMHDNAGIIMREINFVNDPNIVARNPKVTSINSCIELDLTGQVVSDSIGPKVQSGVGGQLDFVRGATWCPDGRSIMALPSTTGSGQSRIVHTLTPGGGVVTPRAMVDYVVTEWGIAGSLRGKSLQERAKALIGIAHPDCRAALTDQARKSGLLLN